MLCVAARPLFGEQNEGWVSRILVEADASAVRFGCDHRRDQLRQLSHAMFNCHLYPEI